MSDLAINPLAQVVCKSLGSNTRIAAYSIILERAKIGSDCEISSHCLIENDVVIGDRVTIQSGVQICDGITIEDDVFIGPNVTFTNIRYPSSRKKNSEFLKTIVKKGASVGAGTTLLPGITIGTRAIIGAGSVVTSDVPPSSVVVGNPARIIRYVETVRNAIGTLAVGDRPNTETMVGGAKLIPLRNIRDARGQLTVAQWSEHLPFNPLRVFFIHHVPSAKVRGGHAHRQCHQILLALTGSARVVVDDGTDRQEYVLNDSARALLIPAGAWATQYDYTPDCVLAVFASHEYDESDYIRDYDKFLEYSKK